MSEQLHNQRTKLIGKMPDKLVEQVYNVHDSPDKVRVWIEECPVEIKQRLLRYYLHREMYEHCAVINATIHVDNDLPV